MVSSALNALVREVNSLRQDVETARDELRQHQDGISGMIADLHLVLSSALQGTSPDVGKQLAYRLLVRQIRHVVGTTLTPDASVIVVSRGDDELLTLGGRSAQHFPQRDDGVWAGEYPSDSSLAIKQLEELRAKGAGFLLVPRTSLWWLEYYGAFRWHLERTCRLIYRSDDTCWIFALRAASPWQPLAERVVEFKTRLGRYPAILDWETGSDLARLFPECAVFDPVEAGRDTLPYCGESIDMVAVTAGEPARLEDARRVAVDAVLTLSQASGDRSDWVLTIEERQNDRLPEHRRAGDDGRVTPLSRGRTASSGIDGAGRL